MEKPRLPHISRRAFVAAGAASAAVAGGVAFGVSRCSRSEADVPAEPAAGDSADSTKRGGKLMLYTSCEDSLVNAVVPAFMQETSIVVEVVQMGDAELAAAVADEVASGSVAADVAWGGDASWYAAGAERYERYISAQNSGVREECRNTDGFVTSVTREVCVILVNKEQVKKLKLEIEGYEDLLDEKLAGLVAVADPHVDAAGLSAVAAVLAAGAGAAAGETATVSVEKDVVVGGEGVAEESATEGGDAAEGEAAAEGDDATGDDAATDAARGRELLAGIIAQTGGTLYATSEDAAEAVLSGEAVAGLVYEQAAWEMAELTDEVEVVYPSEGCFVALSCSAIVRGSTNNEQARAWIDFVAGETCQKAAAEKTFARSVRDGVSLREGMLSEKELEKVALEAVVDDPLAVWDELRG